MTDSILVINAGSSSIKFQLFAVTGEGGLARQLKGQFDGIGTRPRLVARDATGQPLVEASFPASAVADANAAMAKVGAWLRAQVGELPTAVGHRVVHGGARYDAPVVVDEAVLTELDRLVPLAPLHQPSNLMPIRALRANFPHLPQVACFDTAFHRGHPELADRYAIPEALYAEGVRRYGFHGLSYEYIASRLPKDAPEIASGRVVVAHLGSGASMCAMQAGRSVDSTMGFSALDGLPMGTRPGQIDPTVILYLLTAKGMTPAGVERLLYRECGLKGLSGISNDMRDLEASKEPAAKRAIDYFCYRVARELGALAASLGGLDGLVFTAGVGENSPAIRADVGRRASWLGVALDDAANATHGPRISARDSKVSVFVIPTDEEQMIARHTLACLRQPARLSA